MPKITNRITVHLSKVELQKIISDYVLANYPDVKVKEVDFDYGKRLEGFGSAEREEPYFEGADVECEPK